MKNIFALFIFLLSISSTSFGQGNLQFNQVINGEITALVDYDLTTMGTITVPTGKVWKVESVSMRYFDGAWATVSNATAWINKHHVWDPGLNIPSILPLWLSPGTYTISAVGSNETIDFTYSVIEFNVIP